MRNKILGVQALHLSMEVWLQRIEELATIIHRADPYYSLTAAPTTTEGTNVITHVVEFSSPVPDTLAVENSIEECVQSKVSTTVEIPAPENIYHCDESDTAFNMMMNSAEKVKENRRNRSPKRRENKKTKSTKAASQKTEVKFTEKPTVADQPYKLESENLSKLPTIQPSGNNTNVEMKLVQSESLSLPEENRSRSKSPMWAPGSTTYAEILKGIEEKRIAKEKASLINKPSVEIVPTKTIKSDDNSRLMDVPQKSISNVHSKKISDTPIKESVSVIHVANNASVFGDVDTSNVSELNKSGNEYSLPPLVYTAEYFAAQGFHLPQPMPDSLAGISDTFESSVICENPNEDYTVTKNVEIQLTSTTNTNIVPEPTLSARSYPQTEMSSTTQTDDSSSQLISYAKILSHGLSDRSHQPSSQSKNNIKDDESNADIQNDDAPIMSEKTVVSSDIDRKPNKSSKVKDRLQKSKYPPSKGEKGIKPVDKNVDHKRKHPKKPILVTEFELSSEEIIQSETFERSPTFSKRDISDKGDLPDNTRKLVEITEKVEPTIEEYNEVVVKIIGDESKACPEKKNKKKPKNKSGKMQKN